MRITLSMLCVCFLGSALAGCGGGAVPAPSDQAKPGPPPGASPELTKTIDKKFRTNPNLGP